MATSSEVEVNAIAAEAEVAMLDYVSSKRLYYDGGKFLLSILAAIMYPGFAVTIFAYLKNGSMLPVTKVKPGNSIPS